MRLFRGLALSAVVSSVLAFHHLPPTCRPSSGRMHMTAGTESKKMTVQDVKNSFYKLLEAEASLKLPDLFQQALVDVMEGTTKAAEEAGTNPESYKKLLGLLLGEAAANSRELFQFKPFHRSIREPQDYQSFGEQFFDIVLVKETSGVLGKRSLLDIVDQVRAGHNVVLLANHQTEPDPYILRQAFKTVVGPNDPILDKLVFVAGAKVRTDLFTIPFSKGLNLICIHSKKYIDEDPNTKAAKMAENMGAMKALGELLQEGGYVLWVAPSGGRDRLAPGGERMAVAPFDSRACDMFRLLSSKSDKPSHFYSLAMLTYKVLPPPQKVAFEIGERRLVARRPVHLHFGHELTPEYVAEEFIKRKSQENAEASEADKEGWAKQVKKEGFSFIAEDDTKRNYEALEALDKILEYPEVHVTYK